VWANVAFFLEKENKMPIIFDFYELLFLLQGLKNELNIHFKEEKTFINH
jgi:hypothetical protein